MREVSVTWTRDSLAETDLSMLDAILERLTFVANLLITPEGVRQIIIPVYKEGKSVDDLGALPYIEVEQRLNERESEAVVVWNTHALVCLASTTENIHVIPPAEYHDGSLTLTLRGIPKAVSSFVKLSKVFLAPAEIRVSDVRSQENGLQAALTARQYECYALALKHGYYQEPKAITMQALADILDIARSTFQEHLQAAEQAVLLWAGDQI